MSSSLLRFSKVCLKHIGEIRRASFMTEGLAIRRATRADKQSVLNIRADVYDGRDYLPCYYDHFMESEAHISYVAEIEGIIVAFCSGFIVDDGRTVVSRAGRASRQYSGEGAYRRLKSQLLEESGAEVNASVLVDANPAASKTMMSGEKRLLVCRPFLCYRIKPDVIRLPGNFTKVPTIGLDSLAQFITEDRFRNYLFSSGRIIVDWIPFQLEPSNISLIHTAGIQLEVISNVRTVEDRVQGVLIFYSKFSYKNTDYYNVDVYGTDISAFRDGIVTFLSNIVYTSCAHIDIIMALEANMDGDALRGVMEEFELQSFYWIDPQTGRPYSKLFAFERDLQ